MTYQLDEVLGTGRGGPVYRASNDRLGAPPAAVRMLAVDERGFAHLRRHAEALALVGHPSLGLIDDVVRVDDGTVMVATPLGHQTLRDRLNDTPLDVTEVLRVIEHVASALAAAHRAALPHGAVHAGNVVWVHGSPRLVDLGLEAFRAGVAGAATPTDAWRRDRADLIELARGIAAPLAPPETTRTAALLEMVGPDANAFVADEMGLSALARACDRIAHRPDETLVDPVPEPHVESCEDVGAGVSPIDARSEAERARALLPGAVAACALVIGGIVGVGMMRAARPDNGVPVAHREPVDCGDDAVASGSVPGLAVPIEGTVDRDGDGCLDHVWWSSEHAVLHVAVGDDQHRFSLGEPGDQAVVGDWDCDGESTMGLYRPRTGETFHFDGWADHDEALVASPGPTLERSGHAEVFDPTADGQDCDRITLR